VLKQASSISWFEFPVYNLLVEEVEMLDFGKGCANAPGGSSLSECSLLNCISSPRVLTLGVSQSFK